MFALLLALQVLAPAAPCVHDSVLAAAASAARVPAILLRAVARVESRCDPLVVSTSGARGLMQVMPSWLRSNLSARCGTDLHDPATSACFGARILAYEHHRFGSWPRALAAYSGYTPGYVDAVRAALHAIRQGDSREQLRTPPAPRGAEAPAVVTPATMYSAWSLFGSFAIGLLTGLVLAWLGRLTWRWALCERSRDTEARPQLCVEVVEGKHCTRLAVIPYARYCREHLAAHL